jgi:hypothetical protein
LIGGLPAPIEISIEPNVTAVVYLGGRPLQGYVPIDLSTGMAALTVATGAAPPYRPTKVTLQVFVLNPLQLAAAVALILLVARFARAPATLEEVNGR